MLKTAARSQDNRQTEQRKADQRKDGRDGLKAALAPPKVTAAVVTGP